MEIITAVGLGRLARQIREELSLSQAGVATRLSGETNIAQNHVSLAERGDPKYVTLALRIVRELGGKRIEPVFLVDPEPDEFAALERMPQESHDDPSIAH